MPFYRNRRRWYGRRRFGYRRWPYSSWRRRGASLYRSQTSGARRFGIVIPVEQSLTIPCTGGTSYRCAITPFYSTDSADTQQKAWLKIGNLVTNTLFTTYCGLYDEVKINGFTVKFSITGTTRGATCGKLYTCIDRHGAPDDFDDNNITLAKIQGGAEHQTFSFTSTDRATCVRYFNARDLMEKVTFVDSSIKVIPVGATSTAFAHNVTCVQDWYVNGRGGFVPMLFFVLDGLNGTANSACGVDITVKWNVTFRNPKFTPAAAAKGDEKSVEVEPVRSVGAGKIDGVSDVEDAFKKLRLSGVLGDDDDVVLKKWKEKRMARKKKGMKIRALLKAMDEEKDDDTLIDPEEEVLPDDDLLMEDDDDVPTQPIKELENKSSS